jgi:uncharacterized protein YbjT (DUF2867 family)
MEQAGFTPGTIKYRREVDDMFAIAGASGNTGAATAAALLEGGAAVRAVVRDPAKGERWAARGAQVAVADLADVAALTRAFEGAEGAYVLNPPAYTLPDPFSHAELLAASIAAAARASRLPRLVVLSSMGAHLASGNGLIRTNGLFERELGQLDCPVVFLRPAYFMENWAWVAPVAAQAGVLPSFLLPTHRAIPMVAASDIGALAARALGDEAMRGVIELEGPQPCSADDAAAAFSVALGKPVVAVPVPEAEWAANLQKSGFSPRTIEAWIEMFRGFNSGAIGFEARESAPLRGRVSIDEAVRAIVQRA